jgi:hypothetical protein
MSQKKEKAQNQHNLNRIFENPLCIAPFSDCQGHVHFRKQDAAGEKTLGCCCHLAAVAFGENKTSLSFLFSRLFISFSVAFLSLTLSLSLSLSLSIACDCMYYSALSSEQIFRHK